MILDKLCAPALLYLAYSVIQIIIDAYKGMYNMALVKVWVAIIFTIVLNVMCRRGLGVISWMIVFVPFVLMSIIASILLFIFGLNPATGKVLYSSDGLVQEDQADASGDAATAESNGDADSASTTTSQQPVPASGDAAPTSATENQQPAPAPTNPPPAPPTGSVPADLQPDTSSDPTAVSGTYNAWSRQGDAFRSNAQKPTGLSNDMYYGALGNSTSPQASTESYRSSISSRIPTASESMSAYQSAPSSFNGAATRWQKMNG